MSNLAFDFDTDINASAAVSSNVLKPTLSYWPDYDKNAPSSAWGKVQRMVDYHNGVLDISTSGHGGLKVTGELAKKIPKHFRQTWYEEHCECVIPLYFLYDEFKAIADLFTYEEAGKYGFMRAIKRKSKEDFKAQLLGYGCYAAIWDFIHGLTRDASTFESEWEQRNYTEKMADLQNPKVKITAASVKDGQKIRFESPVIFTVDNQTIEVTDFMVVKDGATVRFKPIGHAFMARISNWRKMHFTVM